MSWSIPPSVTQVTLLFIMVKLARAVVPSTA